MSLVSILLWSLMGVALGFGLAISMAGTDLLRDMLLRRIFRSNKDGWALIQEGKSYGLKRLERNQDAEAWQYGDDDEAQWVEDPGDLMHSIYGVPFGLAVDSYRPMVDVEAASVAEAAGEKVPDGGDLAARKLETEDGQIVDVGLTMSELEDRFVVGTLRRANQKIQYVNPFVTAHEGKVVDLRRIVKLFKHDAGSDTPRKAAKNAKEAERAFDGMGDIKEFGKIVTAFMLGAIATYIGSSGGGGGGGVNVPIMIDSMALIL